MIYESIWLLYWVSIFLTLTGNALSQSLPSEAGQTLNGPSITPSGTVINPAVGLSSDKDLQKFFQDRQPAVTPNWTPSPPALLGEEKTLEKIKNLMSPGNASEVPQYALPGNLPVMRPGVLSTAGIFQVPPGASGNLNMQIAVLKGEIQSLQAAVARLTTKNSEQEEEISLQEKVIATLKKEVAAKNSRHKEEITLLEAVINRLKEDLETAKKLQP